jgi:hypothetical protein
MLKKSFVLLPVVVLSCLVAGCAGPEHLLGRGMNNMTEFCRFGEIDRSFEQTAVLARRINPTPPELSAVLTRAWRALLPALMKC